MKLDITRVKDFCTCPQLYDYKWNRGLRPRKEDRSKLDFGTAIHAGLEAYYKTWKVERATEAYLHKLDDVAPDHVQRAYGVVMLEKYAQNYPSDRSEFTVISVEKELTRKVGSHVLMGRLDLLVERRSEPKGIYHMQHKTVGHTVAMESYVRGFDLDWHERAYALLAREAGYACNGSIINLLRKTKVPSYLRSYVMHSEEALSRFEHDFLSEAAGIEQAEAFHMYPQRPTSCVKPWGLCAFHSACVLGDVDENEFEKREMDYVDAAVEEAS